jgi:anti-sigma factor (TIGR02949 family)
MRPSRTSEAVSWSASPGCEEWAHAVTLHVDGELGEEERGAFEAHLPDCERCRQATGYGLSYREAIKASVPAAPAPANLKARIRLQLDEETTRTVSWLETIRRWWSPVPVAAAGATAIGITAWFWAGTPPDDIASELVRKHVRNLPPEVQTNDPKTVEAFLAQNLDFRAKIPSQRGLPLSLIGARFLNVHDHMAAQVFYSTPQSPGRHVSMIVYDDPSNRAMVPGQVRRIDDRDVMMANKAGYTVAVVRDGEVSYNFVSDNADDMEELVKAVSHQH